MSTFTVRLDGAAYGPELLSALHALCGEYPGETEVSVALHGIRPPRRFTFGSRVSVTPEFREAVRRVKALHRLEE